MTLAKGSFSQSDGAAVSGMDTIHTTALIPSFHPHVWSPLTIYKFSNDKIVSIERNCDRPLFLTALVPEVFFPFIFSIHFLQNCYIKSFKPGMKPIVHQGSCDHQTFDSGKKIYWKTEDKAKVQYLFFRVTSRVTTHRTSRRWGRRGALSSVVLHLHLGHLEDSFIQSDLQ